MAQNELSAKVRKFVQEYLIDFNGRRAAICAGYSERSADVQASRLLKNDKVRNLVFEKQEKMAAKSEITIEWVLKEAKAQYDEANAANDRKNALKALEMVGKHTNIQAWKERESGNTNIMNVFAIFPKAPSAEQWMQTIT